MSWLDGRSTGYYDTDYIENPAYIIESLLRDECFAEIDLVISGTDAHGLVCDSIAGHIADYYAGAMFTDFTQNTKMSIHASRIDGGITLDSLVTYAIGDKFAITNIGGLEKINTTSFDLVGTVSTGKRAGWKFARSINNVEKAKSTIDTLCYDSHCMLFDSYSGYKLVALDTATSGDTWTTPLNKDRELVSWKLSPKDSLYNSFRLKYYYDYASSTYIKELFVNSKGYTTTVDLSGEQDLCSSCETNYKANNKWEYNSDWIYDETTALNFLKAKVLWHTKQGILLDWTGECKTYIKYEKGDQVKIDFMNMIPSSVNNYKYFMITSKEISFNRFDPQITFQLIEMPSDDAVLHFEEGDIAHFEDGAEIHP